MAYLDTMNVSSTDYALNAFSNLLICSDNITSAKTVTFPDGYNFTDGNNMTFRVLFKNGHNCADASTPMTLNGKAVVVNKYGSLIPLPIYNINSIYKCLQSNTVLEMYYNPNYDGNNTPAFVVVGNPVVLSDTNYTIYADGQMGGCPPINSVYVQYPQCKSPNVIWFLTTWTEINYGGAFFRASGGNADSYIEEGSVLSLQLSQNKSHDHGGSTNKVSEVSGQSGTTSDMSGENYVNHPGHTMYGSPSSRAYYNGDNGERYNYDNAGRHNGQAMYINLSHTHDYDHKHNITSDGGTEARPDNYTIRVWKRTA